MPSVRPPSPEAKPPSVHPPDAELFRMVPAIRRLLRRQGIPASDVDDITQDVLVAAWMSIERGNYRPPPTAEPERALRAWLSGITWNLASHYREAGYRRETPTDPAALSLLVTRDPTAQLEARSALRRLRRLSKEHQAALYARAVEETFEETGEELGMPSMTAAHRMYRARALFLRALR